MSQIDSNRTRYAVLALLVVLLVAPRVAQAGELAVQDGEGVLEFGVELLEAQGEASQFRNRSRRRNHRRRGCVRRRTARPVRPDAAR